MLQSRPRRLKREAYAALPSPQRRLCPLVARRLEPRKRCDFAASRKGFIQYLRGASRRSLQLPAGATLQTTPLTHLECPDPDARRLRCLLAGGYLRPYPPPCDPRAALAAPPALPSPPPPRKPRAHSVRQRPSRTRHRTRSVPRADVPHVAAPSRPQVPTHLRTPPSPHPAPARSPAPLPQLRKSPPHAAPRNVLAVPTSTCALPTPMPPPFSSRAPTRSLPLPRSLPSPTPSSLPALSALATTRHGERLAALRHCAQGPRPPRRRRNPTDADLGAPWTCSGVGSRGSVRAARALAALALKSHGLDADTASRAGRTPPPLSPAYADDAQRCRAAQAGPSRAALRERAQSSLGAAEPPSARRQTWRAKTAQLTNRDESRAGTVLGAAKPRSAREHEALSGSNSPYGAGRSGVESRPGQSARDGPSARPIRKRPQSSRIALGAANQRSAREHEALAGSNLPYAPVAAASNRAGSPANAPALCEPTQSTPYRA
ncbi:hypothetical protein B0H15DRAFT_964216 [Mycena belliarum]|uniref:Uncharacterized protein n=1 Tax=Mycena belliarum TaxID=1033014 RepID=A0AAD6XVG2_9AGAR|nr:hypothetical protein B0H15DRAFT_964216 [Mycena belliae]